MKKIAKYLLVAASLFLISGCSGNKEPATELPAVRQQEDKLIIHLPDYQYIETVYEKAVSIYAEKYPEVEVITEYFGDGYEFPEGDSEYTRHILETLGSDEGPDIIFTKYFDDLYKLIDSGAFQNLGYLAEEEGLDFKEYSETILNAGLYKGGRYFIPLNYDIDIMMTENTALDIINFDLSKNTDFVSFFSEIANCLPKAKENPDFTRMFNQGLIFKLVLGAGVELLDYENQAILPDENAAKKFCEAYKPYYSTDVAENFNFSYGFVNIPKGDQFFQLYGGSAMAVFYDYSRLRSLGFDPALTAIYTISGGLNAVIRDGVAIRYGSKNIINAWNFIKVLLSEEIQYAGGNSNEGFGYFPVHTASFTRTVDSVLQEPRSVSYSLQGESLGEYVIPAITQEDREFFKKIHESITGCVYTNWEIQKLFINMMEPYFLDNKGYDACIDEFREKMKDYLWEK